MRVRIVIMPREGLLDPEARAIEEMLRQNGVEVDNLKVGKIVELELKNPDEAKLIAERFLINPVIEEFSIE
ncbi:MAG: phosphoribosylformylglycinamidine synthase subunit PurS [Aquificaceae bacterium]|nr:phosphoribosylformylglycinamidine synthase subunit PurS [Aquificaceae bacterium]MDW8237576.1 phosphoribosylformylglycinamidine synthase subunit PurS [Aquificaceae bacterium]